LNRQPARHPSGMTGRDQGRKTTFVSGHAVELVGGRHDRAIELPGGRKAADRLVGVVSRAIGSTVYGAGLNGALVRSSVGELERGDVVLAHGFRVAAVLWLASGVFVYRNIVEPVVVS
jgi:hypothetical protein